MKTDNTATRDVNIGHALDVANKLFFGVLRPLADAHPNTAPITDAAGAGYALREHLNIKNAIIETVSQDDFTVWNQYLGEIAASAEFLRNYSSKEVIHYAQTLTELVSDLAKALDLGENSIDGYLQTANTTQVERTSLYEMWKKGQQQISSDEKLLSDLPHNLSTETTRGEKLVGEIYDNCGLIHAICEGLGESMISVSPQTLARTQDTFIKIGWLLGHLSAHPRFVETYFPHTTLTEFKALGEKLKNPATYNPITPELITRFNQELTPIRGTLSRHTGEEAEKQKAVIANYDQVVNIYNGDLNVLKLGHHPILWLTSLAVVIRLGLLPVWDATWTGMLSLFAFTAPIVVLLWRDLEIATQNMKIAYPEEPDFWMTRTHLYDAIAETRKDGIDQWAGAIAKRKKSRRLSEILWAGAFVIASSLNILASVGGW